MLRHEQTEVLVTGAGPVGMLTALLLARGGVRVRIIDQDWRTASRTYACALHPHSLKLLDKLGREPVLKFLDGVLVDLLQPRPALLVKRCGLNLLEQLPDHGADPHDLGRLLDHLGYRTLG